MNCRTDARVVFLEWDYTAQSTVAHRSLSCRVQKWCHWWWHLEQKQHSLSFQTKRIIPDLVWSLETSWQRLQFTAVWHFISLCKLLSIPRRDSGCFSCLPIICQSELDMTLLSCKWPQGVIQMKGYPAGLIVLSAPTRIINIHEGCHWAQSTGKSHRQRVLREK